MRNFIVLLFVASALFLLPVNTLSGGQPRYVPEEVLVKFKPDISEAVINSIKSDLGLETLHFFASVRVYHLKITSALTVDEVVRRLSQHPAVLYAEPNYIQYAHLTPDDPRYDELWGLNNTGQTGGTPDADIDAPEAWDIEMGSSDVVIAVIDSGIDYRHEDLMDNIWVNPKEDIDGDGIPEMSDLDGIDNDGNGYIDDLIGWNFVDDTNNPMDETSFLNPGHGTHVSGTIAAAGDNGIGVVGVNWTAKVMALKFLNKFGMGSTSDAIRAIEYYTNMGVLISNNSWGGGGYSQALYDAIQASHSLFMAAAGNDGQDTDVNPHYPSSYDLENIVSVAATDHNDDIASWSNYGLHTVDLTAPGVNILSTTPNNTYGTLSGTSMATPHVAGVAGLLLAQDPDLTVYEMKWRVLKGTDAKGLPVLTMGRLNADNALAFCLTTPDVTVSVTPLGPTTIHRGDTVPYSVVFINNSSGSLAVDAKVYVEFPDGKKQTLEDLGTITIPGGGSVGKDFSQIVPGGVPYGNYTLFGQAMTATSFDEDPVDYEVVP